MNPDAVIEVSAGLLENQTEVCCRWVPFGRDAVLFISGGEAHIGSVAGTDRLGGDQLWRVTLRGHREDEIVLEAVARLRKLWPGEVMVVAGIHYDSIERSTIDAILANCRHCLEQLADRVRDA